MTPKILVIDGMNMFHRTRSGFQAGEWPVVFNFMRQFRALVEMHAPTRVYLVMEGMPQKRLALMPKYKANRKVDPIDTKKVAQLHDFFRQVDACRKMLEKSFPISVVWHPMFEADDTIYNLIKRSSTAIPWVAASNDSDFTQLLDEFEHVKVYNPMQKTYVEKAPHNYVTWKALRGDGSDNIPAIVSPITGVKYSDKSAIKLIETALDTLKPETGYKTGTTEQKVAHSLLVCDEATWVMFERNLELIRFHTWSDVEAVQMISSAPEKGWERVKEAFNGMGFKSITNDKSWAKFVSTFDHMWGDGA